MLHCIHQIRWIRETNSRGLDGAARSLQNILDELKSPAIIFKADGNDTRKLDVLLSGLNPDSMVFLGL